MKSVYALLSSVLLSSQVALAAPQKVAVALNEKVSLTLAQLATDIAVQNGDLTVSFGATDPRELTLSGTAVGTSTLVLKYLDGSASSVDVEVFSSDRAGPVHQLSLSSAQKLALTFAQIPTGVSLDNEKALALSPAATDPHQLRLSPLASGVAKLKVKFSDGSERAYQVEVTN